MISNSLKDVFFTATIPIIVANVALSCIIDIKLSVPYNIALSHHTVTHNQNKKQPSFSSKKRAKIPPSTDTDIQNRCATMKN